ncbi:hypothetical protein H5J24_16245 [Chryseobacterium capnotolerans]|uniref:hypothetical protein n=1 Tax=Chryseobacterium capnotolerans TaxID=2759528 RepID=UPI001E2F8E71|nr:hypothetical protein [Chryseobacterium capnotolerans]UHO37281.1 hypothetical protein H5J24_16245 [Chryseobacterium capnotolerans]
MGFFLIPSIGYACAKKQSIQNEKVVLKTNLQKQNTKAVVRISPVKNATMVTTATVSVITVVVDVLLLHQHLAHLRLSILN